MNILDEIFARKRAEVEEMLTRVSVEEMKAKALDAAPTRGFLKALQDNAHPVALIAEIKRASPVAGTLNVDADPSRLAPLYMQAGSQCLSVLTDGPGFGGSPADLIAARSACTIPILRKDFTVHPLQIYEARAMGADAILLIVNGLSQSELIEFSLLATELGMDSLIEVHSEEEAEIALGIGAPLIGVNNRDLESFAVSLEIGERVLPLVSQGAFAVGESGIHTRVDAKRLESAGARALLIGSAFSTSNDPAAKIHEVMGR